MNERLRKWTMKIIIGMIEDKIAEWEVRRYALDNYNKGILTSEDLDKIDEMYKEEEPTETVEEETEHNETEVDCTKQLDTEVKSTEQNETEEQTNDEEE